MTLPVKLRLDTTTWGGDLVREGGQFEVDDGFETAALISLFTCRRAEDDDILPGGDDDRRGWWGDAYADVPGDLIGSRLWLLRRAKATQENLNRAKHYAEEALQWLIDDDAAGAVVVTAERVRDIILGLRVQIYRPGAVNPKYDQLWELKLDAL